jgi:hypothetical protein
MAVGKFTTDGYERVRRQVGQGLLRGRVVVDQPYAQYQHEATWLRHPRGGQAKYVEVPLLRAADYYFHHVAEHVLEGDPVRAMRDNVEGFVTLQIPAHAPVDKAILRYSGRAIVEDNGKVVYNRPPVQKRVVE